MAMLSIGRSRFIFEVKLALGTINAAYLAYLLSNQLKKRKRKEKVDKLPLCVLE